MAVVEWLLAETLPTRPGAMRSRRLWVDLAALLRDAATSPDGPGASLGKEAEAVILPGAVARQDLLVTPQAVAVRLRSGRVVCTPRPAGVAHMKVQGTSLERAKILISAAGGALSLEVALRAAYHLQLASAHAGAQATREEVPRAQAAQGTEAGPGPDRGPAGEGPATEPPPAAPEPATLARALRLLTTPLGELLGGREAGGASPQGPAPATPDPTEPRPAPAAAEPPAPVVAPDLADPTTAPQTLRLPDPAAQEFERARDALRDAEAALGDLTDPRERYEVRAAWENLAELETAWNALPRREQRLGELRRALASLILVAQPLIDAREQRWAQHVAFLEEKARGR